MSIINLGIASRSFNDEPSKNAFTQYDFYKAWKSLIPQSGKGGNYRQNNGKYFTN
jgi:hypothetical protein